MVFSHTRFQAVGKGVNDDWKMMIPIKRSGTNIPKSHTLANIAILGFSGIVQKDNASRAVNVRKDPAFEKEKKPQQHSIFFSHM